MAKLCCAVLSSVQKGCSKQHSCQALGRRGWSYSRIGCCGYFRCFFLESLVTWSSAVSSSGGALKLLLPQTQGSALTDGTKKPNWPLVFNEPGCLGENWRCRWWLWKKNNGKKKKSLIRSYQVISQWSNTNANYCYWWQVELLKHNAAFRLKKNHTTFTKNKLFNTQQGASQIAWQCTY